MDTSQTKPPIQPDWEKLVEECKDKIEDKWWEYDNSWVDFMDLKFWHGRLKGELEEVLYLIRNQPQNLKLIKEELVDVVNICAMIHTNIIEQQNSIKVKH